MRHGVAREFHARFLVETGVPVGAWWRRVRLFHALRLLEAGGSVTEVALEVGYANTSAFSHAFAGQFGTSPRAAHGARAGSVRRR